MFILISMKRVYLDNNATTQLDPKLYEEIKAICTDYFGNPSSVNWAGKMAKRKIDEARERIAMLINAKESEIIFTGSGTEGANIAIKGIAYVNKDRGNHIITTSIEHPCVLNTLRYLESKGFEVTYLSVDKKGQIDPDDVKRAIKKKTILISVMYANNEVGNLLPIKEIGKIAKEFGVYFHSDMVQALGKCKIDLNELNVDLASFSGHKAYAPKGVGFLYIKEGVGPLEPLLHGGHQERGIRPGTENTLGIVAMGRCASILKDEIDEDIKRMEMLRSKLVSGILDQIDGVILNGDQEKRLPNTINVSFEGIDSRSLVSFLDRIGVAVSSGAACSSGTQSSSHVLLAMGLPPEIINGAIRISVGKFNTEEEIDYALSAIYSAVRELRKA